MKKLNNKGFTLAEILAVMIILIVLLGMATAGYTKITLESQKSAYIEEAKVQVKGVRVFIESEDIDIEDENVVYYFNYRLGVERSESPFEEWEDCYVVVTYDADSEKNTYYWTGLDKDNWGVRLGKEAELLTKDDIVHKEMTEVSTSKSIDGRSTVMIYNVGDGSNEYTEETRTADGE